LPFTYPPMAAVLFSGLTFLPVWAANTLVTVVSFLCLSVVCFLVTRRLTQRATVVWTVTAAVSVAALALEPVLSTFLFLAAAVGVVNSMLMSVHERTREIGTVRALGMRRGVVVQMFVMEGLVLGLLSAAAGLLAGSAVVLYLGARGIAMNTLTLAWLAGQTRRVQLGTTVCVLPYRHPILVARLAANIDSLSGGRLIFGVGVGNPNSKLEAEAMGVPFQRRGAIATTLMSIRPCGRGAAGGLPARSRCWRPAFLHPRRPCGSWPTSPPRRKFWSGPRL